MLAVTVPFVPPVRGVPAVSVGLVAVDADGTVNLTQSDSMLVKSPSFVITNDSLSTPL